MRIGLANALAVTIIYASYEDRRTQRTTARSASWRHVKSQHYEYRCQNGPFPQEIQKGVCYRLPSAVDAKGTARCAVARCSRIWSPYGPRWSRSKIPLILRFLLPLFCLHFHDFIANRPEKGWHSVPSGHRRMIGIFERDHLGRHRDHIRDHRSTAQLAVPLASTAGANR